MGRLNGTKFCTRKTNSPSALPKMASEMEQPFFLAILTIKDACSLVTLPFVFAGAAALSTCPGLRSRGVWVRVETHTLLAGGTPYFMWQRCALAWRPARGVLSKMG